MRHCLIVWLWLCFQHIDKDEAQEGAVTKKKDKKKKEAKPKESDKKETKKKKQVRNDINTR